MASGRGRRLRDRRDLAAGQERRAHELPVELGGNGQEPAHVERTAGRCARAGTLFAVLAEAAPSHPDLADQWTQAKGRRLADLTRLVRAAAPGREDLVADLADELFVLVGPGVFADFTVDRGWSLERYEAWLARVVEAVLRRAQDG